MGKSKSKFSTVMALAKSYWWALALAGSIAANIVVWADARATKRTIAADDLATLKEKAEEHITADDADNRQLNIRLGSLETKTTGVPDQLADIQKRLGTMEGKVDTVIRLMERVDRGPAADTAAIVATPKN